MALDDATGPIVVEFPTDPGATAPGDLTPALRERLVDVDVLDIVAKVASAQLTGQEIEVRFFDDARAIAPVTDVQQGPGWMTWSGIRATGGDLVFGSARWGADPLDAKLEVTGIAADGEYAVESTPTGHRAIEVDPSQQDGQHEPPPEPSQPPGDIAEGSIAELVPSTVEPAATNKYSGYVDVLAVYTAAARTAMGGVTAVESNILGKLNAANTSNSMSKIAFRFRIVDFREVSSSETASLDDDLKDLRANGDGRFDGVHDWRDGANADLVALFATGYEDYCGLGYVLGAGQSLYGPDFASSAFSVVKIGCNGNQPMAHEMGHNMSLQHNAEDTDANSEPHFDYAHGWFDATINAATVMAYPYNPDTDASYCPGVTQCKKYPMWSDPNIKKKKTVGGVTVTRAMGNASSAYNAKAIASTASLVASFGNEQSPVGNIELVRREAPGVRVAGWAFDPDTTDPATVQFRVDGVLVATQTASGTHGEPAGYVDWGMAGHGFDRVVSMAELVAATGGTPANDHTFCVTALNVSGGGTAQQVDCQTFDVKTGPQGVLQSVTKATPLLSLVDVKGWALDPDTNGPITVQVEVDGVVFATGVANGSNNGSSSGYPTYGTNHGFNIRVTAPSGSWVCVIGLNVGEGTDRQIGCKTAP